MIGCRSKVGCCGALCVMNTNDIKSELSYAYLHAVASAARASCNIATRIEDNNGIDANITVFGPFQSDANRHEVDIKIQLKATSQTLVETSDHLSFSLRGVAQYNRLRAVGTNPVKIVVLLTMPTDHNDWVRITPDELMLKKCARWVSLRGAPETENNDSVTIYIPKIQIFNPASLREMAEQIATGESLMYAGNEHG